jgi:cell division protein FtsN
MAGRIALGLAAAVLLVFFGYALHREQTRKTEIPFRVATYVEIGNSADGIPAPFTVIVYEKRIQKIVPGYVAPVDDVVWVPEPK